MASTWLRREVPLLEALAELEDEGVIGDSSNIAERSGLPGPDVGYGLRALAEAVPPFVVIDGGDQGSIATRVPYFVSVRLGERGRREVGQWPAEGADFESFLELLAERIDDVPDEEEKGRLRRLLDAAQGVSRDVGVALLTAWAKSQTGL